ncbi:MAG: thiamine pyrophosphate-dependent enzyme [Pseudomonadota bacterium]|nr:thiamine pyrophosphate-dependent enzyme [Pseudomonadota bacterium]
MATFGEALLAGLHDRGTRTVFGVPGGGSSLELIEAAGRLGMEFVLTRGETAACLMAAVTGQLTGSPGAALVGVGPGAAAAMNGVAYASLERAPMVLFADRIVPTPARPTWHQVYDQPASFAPVTKAARWVIVEMGTATVAELLDLPLAHPQGPVALDLSAADAGKPYDPIPQPPERGTGIQMPAEARAMLAAARRPVVIAGLQARRHQQAVRAFAAAIDAACLTTFKAKGTIDDDDPALVGHFTGGTAEAALLDAADLIVLVGHDPIEMIPAAWSWTAPVLALSEWDWSATGGVPREAVMVTGDLGASLAALQPAGPQEGWSGRATQFKAAWRQRVRYPDVPGISPDSVVDLARTLAPADARLTVDAGAHMFPALARWHAHEGCGVLKSNGLSTMGYALPAAIASQVVEPARTAVAITGDGGMMMSLGELATAAARGQDIVLIVLNDALLTLIDVKQQKQQRRRAGVELGLQDFAAAARAFGWTAWTVDRADGLEPAMTAAFAATGPRLLDVRIDPSGYGDLLDAWRG